MFLKHATLTFWCIIKSETNIIHTLVLFNNASLVVIDNVEQKLQ